MAAHTPMQPTQPRLSPRRGAAVAGAVLGLSLGPAAGQTENAKDPPTAAFTWSIDAAEPGSPAETKAETEPDWTLDSGLETQTTEEPPSEAQQRADAWMLDGWSPSADSSAALDASFQFRALAVPGARNRADLWARSVYADDASLLTPLTAGREVFAWRMANGLTLAGVGSRRVITDRERGIVFSAEAGIRLAPNAGFQLGYELLQASAGADAADLGAESLFARFQLRF